jgi:hypothetical protein
MTKSLRLTDLQMILLSAASARPDGNLFPLLNSIAGDRDRVDKAIASLLERGLVEERAVADRGHCWQQREGERIGLFITPAGIALIAPPADSVGANDIQTDAPAPLPTPRPSSKSTLVVDLLRRENGASIDELITTTGWLPHTVRAALTGLRKKGHAVVRDKIDGGARYMIKSVVTE